MPETHCDFIGQLESLVEKGVADHDMALLEYHCDHGGQVLEVYPVEVGVVGVGVMNLNGVLYIWQLGIHQEFFVADENPLQ